MLWLAACAFVALAAGLWLTKRIIQRIDGLAQTADRLAAGEYAHRAAAPTSNDELGRLAGFRHYLTKPCPTNQLLQILASLP